MFPAHRGSIQRPSLVDCRPQAAQPKDPTSCPELSHCDPDKALGQVKYPSPNPILSSLHIRTRAPIVVNLGKQAPCSSVSRLQGEEPRQVSPRQSRVHAHHTHSVSLTAHHAALDVIVILLEELVIGHLQLGQLPPEEKEPLLEKLPCPAPAPPSSFFSCPQTRRGLPGGICALKAISSKAGFTTWLASFFLRLTCLKIRMFIIGWDSPVLFKKVNFMKNRQENCSK